MNLLIEKLMQLIVRILKFCAVDLFKKGKWGGGALVKLFCSAKSKILICQHCEF
jgi:hypothetical protein